MKQVTLVRTIHKSMNTRIFRATGDFCLMPIALLLTVAGCAWNQASHNTAIPKNNSAATRPEVQPTMNPSQKLGVSVLTALNSALKTPRISVGTAKDTIILNGTVANEAERQRAATIAKQKGPKHKIVNNLKIAAQPKKPVSAQKPAKNQLREPH